MEEKLKKFGYLVYDARWVIIILVIAAIVASYFFGISKMTIDYNMLDMIPSDDPTAKAMDILKEDRGISDIVQVLTPSVTEPARIKPYVERLKESRWISDVSWIGDFVNILEPKEIWEDEDMAQKFYKDGYLKMELSLSKEVPYDDIKAMESVIENIKQQLPPGSSLSSFYVMDIELEQKYQHNLMRYFWWGILFVSILLVLMFPSVVIPILIITSMVSGVAINMGLLGGIKGKVFFLTVIIVSVLQVAVTLDYSLFLYGRYRENRLKKGEAVRDAVADAIAVSFESILISMLTTFFGFFALTFGTIQMFKNMGYFLMSGVVISFILTLTFLPSLLAVFDKVIFKLRHPAIELDMPRPVGRWLARNAIWLLILVLIVSGVSYYFKSITKPDYDYANMMPKNLPSVQASDALKDVFGTQNMGLVLIPKDKVSKDILKQIEKVKGVKAVHHYLLDTPPSIPTEILPDRVKEIFDGKKYTMAMVEFSQNLLEDSSPIYKIQEIGKPVGGYITGEDVMYATIKDRAQKDRKRINAIAMGLIFLTVALGFRSLLIGLLLMLIIETAIWINIALFYPSVAFHIPIVLGSIQLGATIDYAAYLTSRYLREIKLLGNMEEAAGEALHNSFHSIFTSAGTMFLMTIPTAILSDVPMMSQQTWALARGAFISLALVSLAVIPAITVIKKITGGGEK